MIELGKVRSRPKKRMEVSENGYKNLSHTKRNCKYHIVFAPKFRRQVIYGEIKEDIGTILR